jgi:hypothetical protein
VLWASGFASESLPAVGGAFRGDLENDYFIKNTQVPMGEVCSGRPKSGFGRSGRRGIPRRAAIENIIFERERSGIARARRSGITALLSGGQDRALTRRAADLGGQDRAPTRLTRRAADRVPTSERHPQSRQSRLGWARYTPSCFSPRPARPFAPHWRTRFTQQAGDRKGIIFAETSFSVHLISYADLRRLLAVRRLRTTKGSGAARGADPEGAPARRAGVRTQ